MQMANMLTERKATSKSKSNAQPRSEIKCDVSRVDRGRRPRRGKAPDSTAVVVLGRVMIITLQLCAEGRLIPELEGSTTHTSHITPHTSTAQASYGQLDVQPRACSMLTRSERQLSLCRCAAVTRSGIQEDGPKRSRSTLMQQQHRRHRPAREGGNRRQVASCVRACGFEHLVRKALRCSRFVRQVRSGREGARDGHAGERGEQSQASPKSKVGAVQDGGYGVCGCVKDHGVRDGGLLRWCQSSRLEANRDAEMPESMSGGRVCQNNMRSTMALMGGQKAITRAVVRMIDCQPGALDEMEAIGRYSPDTSITRWTVGVHRYPGRTMHG